MEVRAREAMEWLVGQDTMIWMRISGGGRKCVSLYEGVGYVRLW